MCWPGSLLGRASPWAFRLATRYTDVSPNPEICVPGGESKSPRTGSPRRLPGQTSQDLRLSRSARRPPICRFGNPSSPFASTRIASTAGQGPTSSNQLLPAPSLATTAYLRMRLAKSARHRVRWMLLVWLDRVKPKPPNTLTAGRDGSAELEVATFRRTAKPIVNSMMGRLNGPATLHDPRSRSVAPQLSAPLDAATAVITSGLVLRQRGNRLPKCQSLARADVEKRTAEFFPHIFHVVFSIPNKSLPSLTRTKAAVTASCSGPPRP